ncbi:hypothetical protein KCU84_g63, partial [Aureobasidium melanogenum]
LYYLKICDDSRSDTEALLKTFSVIGRYNKMHFERFLSQKTPIFTLLSKHACVCDFLPIEALNNEKCQIKAQPVRLRYRTI